MAGLPLPHKYICRRLSTTPSYFLPRFLEEQETLGHLPSPVTGRNHVPGAEWGVHGCSVLDGGEQTESDPADSLPKHISHSSLDLGLWWLKREAPISSEI